MTTLAVMLLSVRAAFRKWTNIKTLQRRIADGIFINAAAIFTSYIFLFMVGGIIISYVEDISILSALYETASAIGTVGLTANSSRLVRPFQN